VGAIEPSTGPSQGARLHAPYDPTRVPLRTDELNENNFEAPLVDRGHPFALPAGLRTFQGGHRPPRLFDAATITPETAIDAPGSLEVEGQPLRNYFGPLLLGADPRESADQLGTLFAQVRAKVGEDTLFEYM